MASFPILFRTTLSSKRSLPGTPLLVKSCENAIRIRNDASPLLVQVTGISECVGDVDASHPDFPGLEFGADKADVMSEQPATTSRKEGE